MADEISVSITKTIKNDPLSSQYAKSMVIDQATRGVIIVKATLAADHSTSTLSLTGLTGLGIAVLENIGGASHADEILVGPDVTGTMGSFVRILKGEAWICRLLDGITVKAKTGAAETATGLLQVSVDEA